MTKNFELARKIQEEGLPMKEKKDLEAHNDQLEVWAYVCERAAWNYRHPGNAGPEYAAAEKRARTMDNIAGYLRGNKFDI